MSSTLGRHVINIGPFTLEWFTGGGYVESYLMWRLRGQIVAIYESGSA